MGAINTMPRYAEGGAVKVSIPRDMRPRATPNAEINAQDRDEFRYQQGIFERPLIKEISLDPDGFSQGGVVPHYDTGGAASYGSMQPFGYDPSAYVTNATNWANTWYGNNQQQYQWAQDQFNKNEGTGDLVRNAALKAGDVFQNAANAGVSRYLSLYAPAMQQQLDFARNYTTPAEMARARGTAMAGVGQGFDQAAKNAGDALRLQGLDPKTVASRLDTTVRTQRAASEAAAGTSSDINRELVGQQLLTGAIQTGQADLGLTQGEAGLATANRNQAVNTGLATTASGSATMGTPMQWAQMAGQELQEWPKAEQASYAMANQQGALWNDINRTNLAAQQQASSTGSGWGALLGAGLGLAGSALGGPMGGMLGSAIGRAFSSGAGGVSGVSSGGYTPTQATQMAGWGHDGGVMHAADGAIQTGSVVPSEAAVDGIQGPDKVPAMLETGEGIVPVAVMKFIGEDGFNKFLQKAYKAMGMGPQPVGPKEKPMPEQAMQTGPTFASQGALA